MFITPRSEKCHLAVYDFLVEGALDWSMVSTTSVERPEAMSCTPKGPHFQLPQLWTGVNNGAPPPPPPVREDPIGRESPMESFREGLQDPQTMDGPASTGLLIGDELLQNSREQSNLYHSVQSKRSEGKPEGTVWSLWVANRSTCPL